MSPELQDIAREIAVIAWNLDREAQAVNAGNSNHQKTMHREAQKMRAVLGRYFALGTSDGSTPINRRGF